MDILRWVDQTRAATEDSTGSGASNAERLRSRKRRRLSSPLSASQFSAFSGDMPVAGDVPSTGIAARATTPTPGRGRKRPPTVAADQEEDRDVRRDGPAVLNDLDSTPRPYLPPALHRRAVPRHDDADSESASSLASRGTEESSTAGSGTSSRSPRKKFRVMGLGARPVKDRPLSTDMADGLPAGLLAFCLELDEIVRGKGIAGASSKVLQPLTSTIHLRFLLTSPEPYFQAHPRDAIQRLGAQDEAFTLTRSRVGSTLEPDQCLALLSSAMTCQGESHPEISWNFEVHAPILSAVFRHPTSNGPAPGLPKPATSCNWIAW
jgi:hypothetical protein